MAGMNRILLRNRLESEQQASQQQTVSNPFFGITQGPQVMPTLSPATTTPAAPTPTVKDNADATQAYIYRPGYQSQFKLSQQNSKILLGKQ